MRWNSIAALSMTALLFGCATEDGATARSEGTMQGVKAWPNNDPHLKLVADAPDAETGFAANAFPPPIPDTVWHENAWTAYDCLDCHAKGEADAPVLKHKGMPDRLVQAHCRTCHVLIPGLEPKT